MPDIDKCKLCSKPAEMIYAVDPEKPRPLCGKCFGMWDPDKLNSLLGVKPEVRESGR